MIAFLFAFIFTACIPREDPVEELSLIKVIELPQVLSMNSGMIESNDLFWFINDHDTKPVIYGYNHVQDTIVKVVAVKNAIINDWEEITQNNEHVYIGDFGNNASGNRTDLRIYILEKNELTANTDTVVPSGVIDFSYEDQTDFTPQEGNSTQFDCEAFIVTEDSAFLFTKDWITLQTRIYSLLVEPGTQIAKFRKEWNVSGLITGAAWSENNQELLLLGYNEILSPFLWVYSGFNPGDVSYINSKRSSSDEYLGLQTEAILVSSDGPTYVSSEKFEKDEFQTPASLFRIEAK